jgi:hypothetical protein
LHKAGITHQPGEFSAQIDLDVLGVVRLKISVLTLVEMDQDRHEFTVTQFTASFSMCGAIVKVFARLFRFGLLAEIIDMAVQFQ